MIFPRKLNSKNKSVKVCLRCIYIEQFSLQYFNLTIFFNSWHFFKHCITLAIWHALAHPCFSCKTARNCNFWKSLNFLVFCQNNSSNWREMIIAYKAHLYLFILDFSELVLVGNPCKSGFDPDWHIFRFHRFFDLFLKNWFQYIAPKDNMSYHIDFCSAFGAVTKFPALEICLFRAFCKHWTILGIKILFSKYIKCLRLDVESAMLLSISQKSKLRFLT